MKPNRQKVHSKFNAHCAYCGIEISIKDMQVDHLIPQHHVPRYATHSQVHCEENHIPSCRSCNNYKSGNPLEAFRSAIENQVRALRRDKPTFRLAERYGLIECKPKEVVFYFEQLKK